MLAKEPFLRTRLLSLTQDILNKHTVMRVADYVVLIMKNSDNAFGFCVLIVLWNLTLSLLGLMLAISWVLYMRAICCVQYVVIISLLLKITVPETKLLLGMITGNTTRSLLPTRSVPACCNPYQKSMTYTKCASLL